MTQAAEMRFPKNIPSFPFLYLLQLIDLIGKAALETCFDGISGYMGWVFRLARRRFGGLYAGESVIDAADMDLSNSENEQLKGKPSAYADPFEDDCFMF